MTTEVISQRPPEENPSEVPPAPESLEPVPDFFKAFASDAFSSQQAQEAQVSGGSDGVSSTERTARRRELLIERRFDVLMQGRVARQVLFTRKNSSSWKKLSDEERESAEKALDESQAIRGFTQLPERASQLSVKHAVVRIGQGIRAAENLRVHLDQKAYRIMRKRKARIDPEVELIVDSVIAQTIREFRTNGKTTLDEYLTEGLKPAFEALEKKNQNFEDEDYDESDIRVEMGPKTVVDQYERLVWREVKRAKEALAFLGIPWEDAAQEGFMGILEAERNFDPEKGSTFMTYAYFIVHGRIHDYIREQSTRSRKQQAEDMAISKFHGKFLTEKGKQPTIEEVSEGTGILPARVYEHMKTYKQNFVANLYHEDSGREVADAVIARNPGSNPEENVLQRDEVTDLVTAVESLTPRLNMIVKLYYVDGLTMKEVGERLGISESRASQLNKRAIDMLRKKISS